MGEAIVRALAAAGGIAYAPALRGFIVGCRRMKPVSDAVPRLIAVRAGGKSVSATDNTAAFVRRTVPHLALSRWCDAILPSSNPGAAPSPTRSRGGSAAARARAYSSTTATTGTGGSRRPGATTPGSPKPRARRYPCRGGSPTPRHGSGEPGPHPWGCAFARGAGHHLVGRRRRGLYLALPRDTGGRR